MTGKRRHAIPFKNRSPHGWWIASYLERFEYYDEDRRKLNRRCTAWENTVLIKAKNRDEAWRKTVALGRLSGGSEAWDETGRKGQWRYEGVTSLLPVYETIEDGAEVLWTEHQGWTVKRVKTLVKTKRELNVFDDRNLRKAPVRSKRRSNKQLQRTRRG